ncbi:MAG: hypothetical protein K1X94_32080, partial [Sandaracinaceae bacterium]|nr:hypothetical protein [Sandaracinaceae bacterium]
HLHVGKGYYVRSFARDLARALGTLGHLTALRRTRSGAFTLTAALDGALADPAAREPDARAALDEAVRCARRGLVRAVPQLPALDLEEAQEITVRHGKPLAHASIASVSEGSPCTLVREGRLVAIARREGDVLRVVRGFARDQDVTS